MYRGTFICSAVKRFSQTIAQAFFLLIWAQHVLASEPIKIITLSPHGADLVHAIGAQDYLVGVSEYTQQEYSKNIRGEIPVIGNAFSVDWHLIAKLKPTLVLVWGSGTPVATQKRLKALGIPSFSSEPTTLRDIVNEAGTLAKILGINLNNKRLTELNQLLFKLDSERSKYVQKTVFHPIWPQPLMTINAQHVITDAMKYCGLVNVFENTKGLTPTVNLTEVLRAHPQYLLFAASKTEDVATAQWKPLIDAFPTHKKPKILFVNGDQFHQPGPSLIIATQELCQKI